MSDFTDAFDECIAAQNEANGVNLQARINGQLVDVVMSAIGSDQSNVDGGYVDGATNTLQVKDSDLLVAPIEEQVVVIGDLSYDILSLSLAGGIWLITIGDHEA